jgi:hypothetical protein
MNPIALLMLLVSFCGGAWAAPPDAKAEIGHLLAYLQQSGCSFARNGTWYTAKRAGEHLEDKYRVWLKRDTGMPTAESFIDQVASRSSISGQPYLVRCGDTPPIESGTWFRRELERFRGPDAAVGSSSDRPPRPLPPPAM